MRDKNAPLGSPDLGLNGSVTADACDTVKDSAGSKGGPEETASTMKSSLTDRSLTEQSSTEQPFAEPSSPAGQATIRVRAYVAVDVLRELAARFARDDCSMRAQALCFAILLTIIPVLLFALSAVGYLVTPERAYLYIHQLVAHVVPGKQASRAADEVMKRTGLAQSAAAMVKARGWALCAGVVTLLWTGTGLLVSASAPLNAAWEVRETRSFVKLRAICLGLFLGGGALFLLSLVPSSGPEFVQRLHVGALHLPMHPPFVAALVIQIGFELAAWGIDIAMFVLIYRVLPNARVSWKAAGFGGAAAGLLWELFKKGFAAYLTHSGGGDKLYGALGGLVLLVTWMYYSCIVLLGGAIVSRMYEEYAEKGGVSRKAS